MNTPTPPIATSPGEPDPVPTGTHQGVVYQMITDCDPGWGLPKRDKPLDDPGDE